MPPKKRASGRHPAGSRTKASGNPQPSGWAKHNEKLLVANEAREGAFQEQEEAGSAQPLHVHPFVSRLCFLHVFGLSTDSIDLIAAPVFELFFSASRGSHDACAGSLCVRSPPSFGSL